MSWAAGLESAMFSKALNRLISFALAEVYCRGIRRPVAWGGTILWLNYRVR